MQHDSFIIDIIFKNAEIMHMKGITKDLKNVYENYLDMKFDDHRKSINPILYHEPTAIKVIRNKTFFKNMVDHYDKTFIKENYEARMFAAIYFPIVKHAIFYLYTVYLVSGTSSFIKWDLFQALFIEYGYPFFNYISKKILNQMYLYKFEDPQNLIIYDFNFFYNKYLFYMLPIKKFIIYLLFLLHGLAPIDSNKSFIDFIFFFCNKEFFINNKLPYKENYIYFLNLPFFFKKPFNFIDYIYNENWYLFSKY
jgi:hypothetical protein